MLAGIKFIARDEIDKKDDKSADSRKKSSSTKKKERRKKGHSSSDNEGLEKIRKKSSTKKWYSSEEYSDSSESSGSEGSSDKGERVPKRRDKKKRKHEGTSRTEGNRRSRDMKKRHREDDGEDIDEENDVRIVRKEMGLEWMSKPKDGGRVAENSENQQGESEPAIEEVEEVVEEVNPRELNPYLRGSGCGYPEDSDQMRSGGEQLLSSSLVGDGGASWKLKALKRAKEQAAREGRRLDEVLEERWGSSGNLTDYMASHTAAPPRAHLHAIRSRKMGSSDIDESDASNKNKGGFEKSFVRDGSKEFHHPQMKAPKVHDSLSWGKRRAQKIHDRDVTLVSSAISSPKRIDNDGSFMDKIASVQNEEQAGPSNDQDAYYGGTGTAELDLSGKKMSKGGDSLSANQLAAKALQLHMKGKHQEAEELMKEAENARLEQEAGQRLSRQKTESSSNRYLMQDMKARNRKKEDDSDLHLAQRITNNRQYSISGRADDEYDYDNVPSKKSKKKADTDVKVRAGQQSFAKRIITQQERCQFCFENPNRPKHLVIALANFTYLMLPQRQPVVPGHCCIVTLQHESATRTVDDNTWEEIRNFKKCLIMMFAKEEKDMVFLETVVGLAKQRRHCLIECIPLPQEIAKQAPLYFKKAIDEAEEEWSQHHAKRLIDTSEKGLRASIPKDFPYFHVEFGLKKGFVHVIDDETKFKSSLGLNVIRGMLELPEEDMYRRRRYETVEAQKEAAANFSRDWEPFDWTKQLD